MYNEFISFLNKYNLYDEDIVKYFFKDAFIFNYKDNNDFSECLYVLDDNDILIKIRACIPKMVDYKTVLINIHEYVHYYTLYKKIGKKIVIGLDYEVLPMLYEKIFVIEKNDDDLFNYWNIIEEKVLKENNSVYVYALEQQEDLLHLFYKENRKKKLRK